MNLDQVRAGNAFGFVASYQGKPGDFLGLARTLPVMLQTNGLLATWAHLLAKGARSEEYRDMARALLAHFRHQGLRLAVAAGDEWEVFLQEWARPATGSNGTRMRRLTAEAIAYSVWLKRAAEALCAAEEGGDAAPAREPAASGEGSDAAGGAPPQGGRERP